MTTAMGTFTDAELDEAREREREIADAIEAHRHAENELAVYRGTGRVNAAYDLVLATDWEAGAKAAYFAAGRIEDALIEVVSARYADLRRVRGWQ